MTAALSLAGRDWLVPAAIAAAVALVMVGVAYVRTPGQRGVRLAAAALKLAGVVALLTCLLEPMWSGQRAKPGANQFALVADNSQSMTLRDAGAAETRGEAMRRVVTGERNGWRTVLGENFDVRNYLADARLQQTSDFRDLAFEGRSSSLGAGLRQLAERHRGQPLAGIVLLSDGIAPDLADAAKLAELPPIYPVVFGHGGPERDLAVGSATVSQTSFEDAPVTIQAEIAARGLAGEEVVAKLLPITPGAGARDAAQPVVAEQTITLPRDAGGVATARFQIQPAQTGVIFYRLTVRVRRDVTDEATLVNNETVVAVDRGGGPHRVLYVAGRPNWEYKFLRRAVQGDAQTQLVALIRVAKREPKFEFRGRIGESSNPLFRGFGDQAKEDVERYDQPVIVRLATDDDAELRGGFPKTAEELFKYRAVILDDLEAEFFTADQMSLLRRFVSERGGGLLMLGGMESLREGKFARTAIGDLLPVYLDPAAAEGAPMAGPLRLALTREGWLLPWARLRMTEAEERARLGAAPAFEVLNRVGAAKPAAQVVATVSDGRAEFPALVTQRFGRGRTAALLIGDFWQSGLADEARQADLAKAWRQMVRWLVADVPEPIEVRVEPRSEGVLVQVQARDGKFEPLENATVTLKITRAAAADAAAVTLNAEASAGEPGVYQATFLPRESGGYRVEATVTNEAGAPAGSGATGWSSDLGAEEFRALQPNRVLMEQLARQTGGRVLAPGELEAFARELPSKRAVVNETWTRPLWHTPWMFAFALACLVGEWGLRRWKGLA